MIDASGLKLTRSVICSGSIIIPYKLSSLARPQLAANHCVRMWLATPPTDYVESAKGTFNFYKKGDLVILWCRMRNERFVYPSAAINRYDYALHSVAPRYE